MSNYQWYLNKKREELIKQLDSIPEYSKKGLAETLELALQEFILKHGKSNNPQCKIELFSNQHAKAIPNIYEEDYDIWEKFYKNLNKIEYEQLTNRLSDIVKIHKAWSYATS